MTPDKPEVSVEELIKAVSRSVFRERGLEPEDGDAIRSILTDYATLKAENEWMSGELEATRKISTMADAEAWKARAEKAEAEVKTLKEELAGNDQAYRLREAELRDLRAFKERWAKVEVVEGPDGRLWVKDTIDYQRFLRALASRRQA